MKSIALVFLAALSTGVETESKDFMVSTETFAACQFVGEYPCIKLADQPITLVFKPGDVLDDIFRTAENSRFQGILIGVEDYDPVPMKAQNQSWCTKENAGKTCFEVFSVTDVLVLVTEGGGLQTKSTTINGRPIVVVTPKKSSNFILE